MYKFIIILFLVCFGLYVWFSRQPDYFDGQFTNGTVHFMQDSISKKAVPAVSFSLVNNGNYTFKADYLFNNLKEGESVQVIYDTSRPENAAVYSFWGYWINWKEVLGCIAGYVILFYGALKITQNPSEEALKELEEDANKPRRKRPRYDA